MELFFLIICRVRLTLEKVYSRTGSFENVKSEAMEIFVPGRRVDKRAETAWFVSLALQTSPRQDDYFLCEQRTFLLTSYGFPELCNLLEFVDL